MSTTPPTTPATMGTIDVVEEEERAFEEDVLGVAAEVAKIEAVVGESVTASGSTT